MAQIKPEGFRYLHVQPDNVPDWCVTDTDCECEPVVVKKMVPIHVVIHMGVRPCGCADTCECDNINKEE